MSAYLEREVAYAVANLRAGYAPRDILCSLNVLVAARQVLRAEDPTWGKAFHKDPRRFSSTPRMASEQQVAAFIDGVRIQ